MTKSNRTKRAVSGTTQSMLSQRHNVSQSHGENPGRNLQDRHVRFNVDEGHKLDNRPCCVDELLFLSAVCSAGLYMQSETFKSDDQGIVRVPCLNTNQSLTGARHQSHLDCFAWSEVNGHRKSPFFQFSAYILERCLIRPFRLCRSADREKRNVGHGKQSGYADGGNEPIVLSKHSVWC